MIATRPESNKFWKAYLNYIDYPDTDPNKVWKKIGGNIGGFYGPKNENSCAARVSRGLNYADAPVEAFGNAASLNFEDRVYEGTKGDGKRYIVSAKQMADYLKAKWGAADRQIKTQKELEETINNLGSKCAIFSTPNPSGGFGHAGVLRSDYKDKYVAQYLPVDMWTLP